MKRTMLWTAVVAYLGACGAPQLGGEGGAGGGLGESGGGGGGGAGGGTGAGGNAGGGGGTSAGGGPGGSGGSGAGGGGAAGGSGGGTATTCTSGLFATPGAASASMDPGLACVACHRQQAVVPMTAAGTVYASLHEADECRSSVGTGAVVEILDTSGAVQVTLVPNAAGNFFTHLTLPSPYLARVTRGGQSLTSVTPHAAGDCNGCHTAQGNSGAAGRIVSP